MTRAAFFDAIRPLFGGMMTPGQVTGTEVILVATAGLPISHRAYLLATVKHETAHTMEPIHERGKRAYFDKYEPGTRIGKRLGNTQPGDGYRFRGRGFVQITGRANYARAGQATGADLIGNPDAALNPDLAARILVRGCGEGWFTGKKLGDYLPGDYVNARRVVNGTDKAAEIAMLAEGFEAALRHLGHTVKPQERPVEPAKPPRAPEGPETRQTGWALLWRALAGILNAILRRK